MNLLMLAIGGGGCGKSFWLLRIVRPLVLAFFGPDCWAAQAPANQAARLIEGRTVHSSAGLRPQSSLKTQDLVLKGLARKRQELRMENVACWALDEAGQCAAALFHGSALRCTYARALKYNLKTADYILKHELFGRMPLTLILGDFLQLPPFPPSTSFLNEGTKLLQYEHRQGKATLQQADYVFAFAQSMRFDDPNLKHILEVMRTKSGGKIKEEAWQALVATQVVQNDPRLIAAWDWKEGAYEWQLVSMAQQLAARCQAARERRILFYLPAVDMPEIHCSKTLYREMTSEYNLTTTAKLMSVLPLYVGMKVRMLKHLSQEVGPESEGTVVGLELNGNEPTILANQFLRESVRQNGYACLRYLPTAVYVKFDNVDASPLPPKPCAEHMLVGADTLCPACKFFKGIFAIKPVSAPWKFTPSTKHDSGSKRYYINVNRWQIPLAPANQKTLHTLQGMTARPGLKAHWHLPERLSHEQRWLSTYVILSRPRSLATLLSFGLPSRELLEGGPPPEFLDSMDALFADKVAHTFAAASHARAQCGWPARN